MRSKSQAIVLHTTQLTDSKSIVHLYTRDFGRVDYVVYGVGSKRGKMKKSLFEPLSVLEIEVNHQPTQSLQRLDDIQLSMVNHAIAADMCKRTICLFIAEVLYRSLKHPMKDEQLFDYLVLAIQTLEQCDNPQNFHLTFLLRLTQFLGFYPDLSSRGQWLDLRTGVKQFGLPQHPDCMSTERTELLERIEASDDLTAADVAMSRSLRTELLNDMILFYSLHLDNFHEPKSLEVLAAVFD